MKKSFLTRKFIIMSMKKEILKLGNLKISKSEIIINFFFLLFKFFFIKKKIVNKHNILIEIFYGNDN